MPQKEDLLLELLESEHASLREIYLANFSVERPSPSLLAKVVDLARNDPADPVRAAAIQLLARFWPDVSVVALFRDLLATAAPETAAVAVKAMSELSDASAIQLLYDAFRTRTDFRIRGAVVLALDRRPFALVRRFLLEQALVDPDEFLRAMAATAVSKKGDPSVVPHLKQRLEDSDPRVRANAVEGLGRFARHVALDLFVGMLADPNHRVQTAALKVLFRLGWDGIDHHLESMARSSVGLFRDSATYFLREVQTGRAPRSCGDARSADEPAPAARPLAVVN
jgi:hypothetical protein